jgi:hypothetical protein
MTFDVFGAISGSSRAVRNPAGFTIPLSVLNASDAHIPARHAPYSHEIVLPTGTWCQVHIHTLHNSVDNWGPNAKEFRPERFLPQGNYLGGTLLF